MKISPSLPVRDVQFLDSYAQRAGYPSRSAVLRRAVRLLRESELGDAYEAAWAEWNASSEAEAWDDRAVDGRLDTPR